MDSAKTKQRKVTATHENQLPWELTEEILSRVSPKSLVRFRIVCKRWNSIIDDKKFINNHKETFKFILKSKSKIYSVSIDPKIVVPELTLDIPGLETHKRKILVDCDEFVRCNMDKKAVVWNPWLKSDKRRRHMRNEEQLPRELIEEILSRVSPKSLLRFRIVCKRWKAIMDDKTFISNHKETFRFILSTKSKIYSVSIDPKIVVRELTLDIPGLESQNPKDVIDSDEFLICVMDEGAAVWNPWLKHSVWITHKPGFFFEGICYNGSNRKSDEVRLYKTLWRNNTEWKSHEFPLSAWEDAKFKYNIGVSLNGSLFWVAYRGKTDPMYWLLNFNFSKERKSRFCKLPCRMNHPHDALVLRVFKGDRFSVLKQCHVTKKIEIWVTKNKVNVEDGNDVVWMNFMTLSIPNFPRLIPIIGCRSQQPSYYIDDKRLIVCSCDENGQAWIHVLGENKLISKVQLDSVVGFWPSHCAIFPAWSRFLLEFKKMKQSY